MVITAELPVLYYTGLFDKLFSIRRDTARRVRQTIGTEHICKQTDLDELPTKFASSGFIGGHGTPCPYEGTEGSQTHKKI